MVLFNKSADHPIVLTNLWTPTKKNDLSIEGKKQEEGEEKETTNKRRGRKMKSEQQQLTKQ